MVYLITIIMSTTFILIVEVIEKSSQIKSYYLPLCDLILLRLKTPEKGNAHTPMDEIKGTSQQ